MQRRLRRRGRVIVVAAMLASLGLAETSRPALAWGRMGHRAAAKLAEARLSASARAAVRSLLEPGESLADASTWADEHRRALAGSGPWHYVNVPITAERYDARFCPAEGCVVVKISDFRRILADTTASRGDRQQALRFLVHFVQDMHQPLHVGDRGDRGGNDLQLQFFGRGSNLHSVWDSRLFEREYRDESALLADLSAAASGDSEAWTTGTVEDWADESLAAARRAYRLPGSERELRPGSKLERDYLDANLPVARRRLAQSGVRLAAMLNSIFEEAP
jgi:hypothetical protein